MLRKDKKGFTLTEVIATLAILGVILLIAIPGVGKLQENFKKNYYEQLDGSVLAAAKTYYKDNAMQRPVNLLEASFLKYDDLKSKKYIDAINQYNTSTACTGRVVVVKVKDDYVYKNCMDCGEYKTKKDNTVHDAQDENICLFDSTDHIEAKYSDIKDLTLHVANYTNEQIKNELCKKKEIARVSTIYGTTLYAISNESDMKCPINISAIDYRNVEGLEKTYNIKYEDGSTADVIIFQHPAPVLKEENLSKITDNAGNIYYYTKGKIDIALNDTQTFDKYNSQISGFQYYDLDNKIWKDTCNKNEILCNIDVSNWNTATKFRVVGKAKNKEGKQLGKQSKEYKIVSKEVNITFDKDGGTGGSDKSTVWKGFKIEEGITPPIRDRYKFKGYADSTGTLYYDPTGAPTTDEKILVDELELIAVWEEVNLEIPVFDFISTDGSYNLISNNSNTKITEYRYFSVMVKKDSTQPIGVKVTYNGQESICNLDTTEAFFESEDLSYYKGVYDRYYCVRRQYTTGGNHETVAHITYQKTNTTTETLDASITHVVPQFTIKYDLNGGTGTITDQTVLYGQQITIASGTTKRGHTFAGWTTNSNKETDDGYGWKQGWTGKWKYFNGQYGISNDTLTLYARWTPDTYTINYVTNGGVAVSSQTVKYGETITIASGTTKTGYTFKNWTTNYNGTYTGWKEGWTGEWKYINGEYGISNKTLTLTAAWTANTYTVQFYGNGHTGGSTASKTCTYGSACTLTSNGFTKTNWNWTNWNTKADGTGTIYTNKQSVTSLATSGTVNLYAIWTPDCSGSWLNDDSADEFNGWHRANVTISLSETSGLKNYLVTTDSTATYTSKTTSATQSNDTAGTMWYVHMKSNYNTTKTCSLKVKKDTVAPTIQVSDEKLVNGTTGKVGTDGKTYYYSATLTFDDATSGVQYFNYGEPFYNNFNNCYTNVTNMSPQCSNTASITNNYFYDDENGNHIGLKNAGYVAHYAFLDPSELKWSPFPNDDTDRAWSYIRVADKAGNWKYTKRQFVFKKKRMKEDTTEKLDYTRKQDDDEYWINK